MRSAQDELAKTDNANAGETLLFFFSSYSSTHFFLESKCKRVRIASCEQKEKER